MEVDNMSTSLEANNNKCRYPLRNRERVFGQNLTNIPRNNEIKRGKRKSTVLDLEEEGPPKKRQRNSYNLRSRSRDSSAMPVDTATNSVSCENSSSDDPMEGMPPKANRRGRKRAAANSSASAASAAISESDKEGMETSKDEMEEGSSKEGELPLRPPSEWDKNDAENELACVPYVNDIMERLHAAEEEYTIGDKNDYMSRQRDINSRMRTILLDWLVEVHRKFQLHPATFFLAVNLLDRYLADVQVVRNELQLTGCACLWLASKYHEIYAPEMEDFVFISDGAFTQRQLIQTESDVVSNLKFALTVPTPLSFAERFIKVGCHEIAQKRPKDAMVVGALANYLIEHCVMDYSLTRKKPSKIAAASIAYALLGTKLYPKWPEFMEEETGYSIDDMWDVISRLDVILKMPKEKCKHRAVRKKYSQSKNHKVALLEFRRVDVHSFLSKE